MAVGPATWCGVQLPWRPARAVAANNVRAITKTKRKRAEGQGQIEMLSKDELRAIIAATPDRHRPFILTALLAGLRASELRGMLWTDVISNLAKSRSAGASINSTNSGRRSRKRVPAPFR